jgi:hypothetical protein
MESSLSYKIGKKKTKLLFNHKAAAKRSLLSVFVIITAVYVPDGSFTLLFVHEVVHNHSASHSLREF